MYVCITVCMSGYAFRHASRYRTESWHGVGDRPTRFVGIFLKRPTWGQRSSRGQSALKMPYGYQIW